MNPFSPIKKKPTVGRKSPAPKPPRTFPPLAEVTADHLDTTEAAHYLNRKPRTLHWWHAMKEGPMQPVVVNGRLSWPTAKVRELLGAQ